MARAPIGSFGRALKDVPLATIATIAVRAALERSGVPSAKVGMW
jgi:acetyl-CoA C-acetyltransferase